MAPKILVTDAQMRSGVAVIRSLGRAGYHVIAAEETRFASGFLSKYCRERVVYPSPRKSPDEFKRFLLDYVRREKPDLIMPVADFCLAPVMEIYTELSKLTKIALPPEIIFRNGYDKSRTLSLARKARIPMPRSYFPKSVSDVRRIAKRETFPLIVKPAISSGKRGIYKCADARELEANWAKSSKEFGRMIIQEFVPNGGEFGVYTLLDLSSRPVALSVQRRIRTFPVEGGPSTLRETFDNAASRRAVKMAFRLLRKMSWQGAAMVEFRIDPATGVPKLMEVNPRLWGSLQLSIEAGADFPKLMAELYLTGKCPTDLSYRKGAKCRWFLPGEILWYLSAPGKIKNLPELLRTDIPDDIIRLDDMGPAFGVLLAAARYALDPSVWKLLFGRK